SRRVVELCSARSHFAEGFCGASHQRNRRLWSRHPLRLHPAMAIGIDEGRSEAVPHVLLLHAFLYWPRSGSSLAPNRCIFGTFQRWRGGLRKLRPSSGVEIRQELLAVRVGGFTVDLAGIQNTRS